VLDNTKTRTASQKQIKLTTAAVVERNEHITLRVLIHKHQANITLVPVTVTSPTNLLLVKLNLSLATHVKVLPSTTNKISHIW